RHRGEAPLTIIVLLLFAGARLPTARVMIMVAVATPLNQCRAPRTRPRLVQTILLERAAWLAPLRVRTDRVSHTIMQRCGSCACQGSNQGSSLARRRRSELTAEA